MAASITTRHPVPQAERRLRQAECHTCLDQPGSQRRSPLGAEQQIADCKLPTTFLARSYRQALSNFSHKSRAVWSKLSKQQTNSAKDFNQGHQAIRQVRSAHLLSLTQCLCLPILLACSSPFMAHAVPVGRQQLISRTHLTHAYRE